MGFYGGRIVSRLIDRKMDALIRTDGFRVDAIETGYMKGPKVGTFIYHGWAMARPV